MLNWGRPLTPLARQDVLPTTGASQSIIPHAQLMSTAIPEPTLPYILSLCSALVQGHMPSYSHPYAP